MILFLFKFQKRYLPSIPQMILAKYLTWIEMVASQPGKKKVTRKDWIRSNQVPLFLLRKICDSPIPFSGLQEGSFTEAK